VEFFTFMANSQNASLLFLNRFCMEVKSFAPSKLKNMKASPFSFLISLSLLLALSLPGFSQSGQFTVQIDSMVNQDGAEAKVANLKSQGLNAYWLKSVVPSQGMRYRVRIGRFPSRAAAITYGTRLKQQGVFPDFYAALWEGNTSPFGNAVVEAKPKPVPPPAPAPVVATPKPVVPEPQQAQRIRETPKPVANTTTDKPMMDSVKPVKVQPVPTPAPNNAVPKFVPGTETKPIKTSPLPIPPMEVKPPRDRKASNDVPSNGNVATAVTAPVTKVAKETVAAVTTPAPSVGFTKFEDKGFGYSFEHPNYWSGGNIEQSQLQAQRIDSGAIFRSQQDAAFTHAIWNSLKNANSPAYDNNLIVDLVIKSVGNSAGMQGLTETARRMTQEGDQIKTFVDLKTMFQQTRATTPLEFQGKAVIIRSSAGILLVVAFFSKESAPTMSTSAERIISSAIVP
jgi:SPOR domain